MKIVTLALIAALMAGCSLTKQHQISAYEKRKGYMKECLVGFLQMDLKPESSLELCSSIDGLARGR